jgi:putative PIN family toxin of toxin-antitoxin system
VRVVLDTNILIGALITKGTPPDQLYRAWLRGEFELVTSIEQIHELARTLSRRRLQKHIDASEASVIVGHLGMRAIVLDRPPSVALSTGPADNRILAAAIAGQVDFIVSGDKRHMLALKEVEGIPLITAREAVERLRGAALR